MTDQHLKENSLLNASGNPCCFNFDKYFFPRITAFQLMLLFQIGYHGNKNISQLYPRCLRLFIRKILLSYQVYRRKYSRLLIVELSTYHL